MADSNVKQIQIVSRTGTRESEQLEFDIGSLPLRPNSVVATTFRIDRNGFILSKGSNPHENFEISKGRPVRLSECGFFNRLMSEKIIATVKEAIRSGDTSPDCLKIDLDNEETKRFETAFLTISLDKFSQRYCHCILERVLRQPLPHFLDLGPDKLLEQTGIAIWSLSIDLRKFEITLPSEKSLENRFRRIYDLDAWLSFIHPNDRSQFEDSFNLLLNGDSPTAHLRYRILTDSGDEKWISTIASRRNQGEDSFSIVGLHRGESSIPILNSEFRLFSFLAKKVHSALMITDPDGRIKWFNKAFSKMSGYELHEMIGKKPGDVLQGPLSSRDVIRHMKEGVRLRKAFSAQIINYDSQGAPYCVKIDANPLVDKDGQVTHFAAFETQISEREQAPIEEKRNDAMFRKLFESALDGHLIVSQKDLKVQEANQASSRFFGDKSTIGQSLATVIEPFVRLDMSDINRALLASDCFHGYEEICLDSEKTIPVELTISEAHIGDSDALLVTLRDLSEKRALEEQLHRAQRMEAVGKLAGGVAHDFNNLLSGIRGFAELLFNAKGPSESARDYIRELLKITDRASKLTNQLLSFSKERSGETKITNLNQLIENLFPMLSRILKEDIHCITDLASNLPNALTIPAQIEQVIMNLIVNAQEALSNDDPKISIRTFSKEFNGEETLINGTPFKGNYAAIEVKDNGQGISPETIESIFEPFFTTKHGVGTGLGLSIVYEIVDNSKGFIDVTSKPGKGTEFTIYFPSVFENANTDDESVQDSDLQFNESGSTVLIAEDQAHVREILEIGLKRVGYKLLVAKDGAEAEAIAESFEGEIDLLLTDAIMPKVHGPKLATIIKEKRPNIKIVLMSGLPQGEALENADEEKIIDAYVDKPFSIIKLGALIGSLIPNRQPSK